MVALTGRSEAPAETPAAMVDDSCNEADRSTPPEMVAVERSAVRLVRAESTAELTTDATDEIA
jgi:hypothetical protein